MNKQKTAPATKGSRQQKDASPMKDQGEPKHGDMDATLEGQETERHQGGTPGTGKQTSPAQQTGSGSGSCGCG